MTSALTHQLHDAGEHLHGVYEELDQAYEDLIEAKKEDLAASAAVETAELTLQHAKNEIWNKHADEPTKLGSNEQLRKAKVEELVEGERADLFEARRHAQQKRGALEVVQLRLDQMLGRVDGARGDLRVLEAIAKVTVDQPGKVTPAIAATAQALADLPVMPAPVELAITPDAKATPVDEDLEEDLDEEDGIDHQVPPKAGPVARPADMPYVLALVKGKLQLAAVPNAGGDLAVDLTYVGPKGGEKAMGRLLGTQNGQWQATTQANRKTQSATFPSWGEALDYVLALHDLQVTGNVVEEAKPAARSNASLSEANDRIFAGHADAGDGKLIFGDGWQRAEVCANVLTQHLRVMPDSAPELIEAVTGKVYHPQDRVDTEALAREAAGYHRDLAVFKDLGQPGPVLEHGVDRAAGVHPDRAITEAEQDHAKAKAKELGLNFDQLRQLVIDECDAPDLVMLKLNGYKHLIWRVLPAVGKRAVPERISRADLEAVIKTTGDAFEEMVDEVLEDLPQLEDDFAGV